jgi:hypothetical protein
LPQTLKIADSSHVNLRHAVYLAFAFIAAAAILFFRRPSPSESVEDTNLTHKKRIEARVKEYGGAVRSRLETDFQKAGIAYPPASLALLAFKQERVLEIYAANRDGKFRFIRSYPILGASGVSGPKLREGDLQVPEGLYHVEDLNPDSLFHLALRVNYPNAYDQEKASSEPREDLGGDIMIHGSTCSVGCLAMGDEAAEDLFVLAALTGIENIALVFSPIDFRERPLADMPGSRPWIPELYESIRRALGPYPAPREKP